MAHTIIRPEEPDDDRARDATETESDIPELTKLDIEAVNEPLPSDVEAFLKDADGRIDEFFERKRMVRKLGFFPSDYPLAYGILLALKRHDHQVHRLCEWGSGFGVVVGLGAFLGYESYGIEIDPRLIAPSRRLLHDHGLEAEILEGSFIPESYIDIEQLSDSDTITIMSGAGVNDEVDMDIDDFDVIFAFPWPSEEALYLDLFARYAAYGAVLISYHGTDGVRVYRKALPEDEAV